MYYTPLFTLIQTIINELKRVDKKKKICSTIYRQE